MTDTIEQPTPLTFLRPENGAKEPPNTEPPHPKVPRIRPTKPVPTERITFPKQLELLRTFAIASGQQRNPVTLIEVGKLAQLNPNTVSLATPFLVDVGLLKRTESARFIPSDEVFNFAHAYEWDKATAAYKLAPAFQGAWFTDELSKRLSLRGTITLQDAVSALAEVVRASPEYGQNIRLIVDYLATAGVIERDGQNVRLRRGETKEMPSNPPPSPSSAITPEPEVRRPPSVATSLIQRPEGFLSFSIAVKIDLTELASWSPDRITALFAGVAQVLAAKNDVEGDFTRR